MTTTFIILGITIVLFVWGRWSADGVALFSLLALALSGVIGTSDALAGFGNPTVLMIAALFVVGEGLSRTGVTGWGGKKLLEAARGSKIRLLVVVMTGTALLFRVHQQYRHGRDAVAGRRGGGLGGPQRTVQVPHAARVRRKHRRSTYADRHTAQHRRCADT